LINELKYLKKYVQDLENDVYEKIKKKI